MQKRFLIITKTDGDKTMKNYILYLGIISLFIFTSCEDLTEEEFIKKYDSAESIITVYDHFRSSYWVELNYNGNRYTFSSPHNSSEIRIGYQYRIIFDKKSPEEHFIIMYHQPIKPENTGIKRTIGKVKSISKSKNFVYVTYKYLTNAKVDLLLRVKQKDNWIKSTECLPLEYYSKLLAIKNENKDIVIDLYILNKYKDNAFETRPFVNLDELNK
jgi:hypothetical protein